MGSKRNIVILVNTLKIGGAEKQSVLLYNMFKFTNPTLIVFNGHIIDKKNINLIENKSKEIIKLKGNDLRKIVFLYRFFKKNNVTHLFTFLTKPNFYGSIIAKISGVNFVYTGIRSTFLPKWKQILEKLVSQYFSSGVILNSITAYNKFSKLRFKKLILIPNSFEKISQAISRDKKDIIKIISVGRFVEAKDYITALKAIKMLSAKKDNFIYQIVGYGKQEHMIRSHIAELQLKNYVQILINPENIEELLFESDIYLSTSIYEGTSNAVLEAMNASLPIIATNVGDNRLLIKNNINGFLHEIKDYQSISTSLFKLIDNYDKRINYGIESNKLLAKNHSLKQIKNEYLKLIK